MYKILKLKEESGLKHSISTIEEGNMSFKFTEKNVLNNRKAFLKKSGITFSSTALMWGVHGDQIVELNKNWLGTTLEDPEIAPKVDGISTAEKGEFLALLTADCIPIILYDKKTPAVSLLHAGWQGTNLNICGKGLKMMTESFGTKTKNIIAAFGPSIHAESYIQQNPLQLSDPNWSDFLIHQEGDKYGIDLSGYNKRLLLESGVSENNIIDCGVNTASDKRFYSHYYYSKKGIGLEGRFMTIVGLQ